MKTLAISGRRMAFWGALLLMGWAIYELSIRFEEMVTWLTPVYTLVQDGKITLWDYFSRVNWAKLRTHLFLAICVLLGLYALLTRSRPILSLLSVPAAILMAVFFLGSTNIMQANFWQKLKLIPLVLIALGGLLCFISALGPGKGKKQQVPVNPPRPRHYDPFRMKGPPYQ